MNSDTNAEYEIENEPGYDHCEWDPTTSSEPLQRHELRAKLVDEYESAGLDGSKAFQACVAAMNADLIRHAFKIAEAIQCYFATEPATLESVHRVTKALNDQLRVERQVDRFAQLEVRAAELRQKELQAKQP